MEEHKDHIEEHMDHIDQDKDLYIYYIHRDHKAEDKVEDKAEDTEVHKEQKEQNLHKVMAQVYHVHMVLPN